MRILAAAALAAALAAVVARTAAAADPAVQPLPANTRALATDVAGKATAEERAWASEAGRRRPLPGYDALEAEVRSRFATHRRMSEFDVDRLAFLGVVMGFDAGAAEHTRRNALVKIPTPTPSPMRRVKAPAAQNPNHSQGAELEMINLQSLVSQREMAVQLATQLSGRLNESSRTVAANIGR
ncbi:MAG TPA: hypothetical protein VGM13_17125 [Thermoanaerobaculia bacterium]